MARSYFWRRSIFDSAGPVIFVQHQLTEDIAGETLVRIHGQVWAETGQVIPVSGFPLQALMIYVGFYDGPWASWIAAHPTAPAESSYGFLYQYRAQWHAEEHSIESTRFVRYVAPFPQLDFDIKAQRIVKDTGDGLVIMAWLDSVNGSINPFTFHLQGAMDALYLSAP